MDRFADYHRVLTDFSGTAGTMLSLDRLLHHATTQISGVTQIRRVKIMRYRPASGDLIVEAGVGWKTGAVGNATLPADHSSPPGRSVLTAAPVVIDDLPNDADYRYSELLQEHGILSVVNVPILIDGRVWGVLEVDSEERIGFDESTVAFLSIFANILGLALWRNETQAMLSDAVAIHSRDRIQRDLLLNELQHRVKNNFQVIISFLAMQRRQATSAEDRDRFTQVMDRVQAIALAHDQLAIEENASAVDVAAYLRSLCVNIDPRRERIAIEVHAASVAIPVHRAVLVGLIVNELVTNSLKYAFGDEGGTIWVRFDTDIDRGEGLLTVQDDGRGFPSETKPGTGTTLVEGFVQQLHARIERQNIQPGALTRVAFPLVL